VLSFRFIPSRSFVRPRRPAHTLSFGHHLDIRLLIDMLASTILRFAAVLVAAAPAVHAWGAPAPQPSHTSCTYSCPGQDQGNYSVHQPSCGHESTGMVCSYPTKNPGPFGFNRDSTCTYDEVRASRDSFLCSSP
jgi:hypothetical protein